MQPQNPKYHLSAAHSSTTALDNVLHFESNTIASSTYSLMPRLIKISAHASDATAHASDATEHASDATAHASDAAEHESDAAAHLSDATEHASDETANANNATEHPSDASARASDATFSFFPLIKHNLINNKTIN